MISVVVLTEPDSLWTRLGTLSTSAGVIVALGVALWQVRRAAAERRDREAAQARLVVVEVEYPDPYYRGGQYPWLSWVKITNYSEKPVLRPRIKLLDARPTARWGLGLRLDYDEYSDTEVLGPKMTHPVPFEHHGDGGRSIDPYATLAPDAARPDFGPVTTVIEKWVDVDGVTITFTDAAGLRWERTGNSEPKRVFKSAHDRNRGKAAVCSRWARDTVRRRFHWPGP